MRGNPSGRVLQGVTLMSKTALGSQRKGSGIRLIVLVGTSLPSFPVTHKCASENSDLPTQVLFSHLGSSFWRPESTTPPSRHQTCSANRATSPYLPCDLKSCQLHQPCHCRMIVWNDNLQVLVDRVEQNADLPFHQLVHVLNPSNGLMGILWESLL